MLELTLAAFGPATAFQIAIERLKHAANVKMTYLPYSGGAPVVNALLGDHVTAGLMTYSTASEHLNAGTMRALVTTSRTRLRPLPEVPAIAETGYRDSEMDWWVGILAPAKTPRDRLSQLADWFTTPLESPEMKAKLGPLGLYSVSICGADFARLLREQYDEFGQVIREANISRE